jgi:hypothetical protein
VRYRRRLLLLFQDGTCFSRTSCVRLCVSLLPAARWCGVLSSVSPCMRCEACAPQLRACNHVLECVFSCWRLRPKKCRRCRCERIASGAGAPVGWVTGLCKWLLAATQIRGLPWPRGLELSAKRRSVPRALRAHGSCSTLVLAPTAQPPCVLDHRLDHLRRETYGRP